MAPVSVRLAGAGTSGGADSNVGLDAGGWEVEPVRVATPGTDGLGTVGWGNPPVCGRGGACSGSS